MFIKGAKFGTGWQSVLWLSDALLFNFQNRDAKLAFIILKHDVTISYIHII